jgi:fumarate reductase subunit D
MIADILPPQVEFATARAALGSLWMAFSEGFIATAIVVPRRVLLLALVRQEFLFPSTCARSSAAAPRLNG